MISLTASALLHGGPTMQNQGRKHLLRII